MAVSMNYTNLKTAKQLSTPAPTPAFDPHLKPREERDFKEIYPDLEDQSQLRVFVKRELEDSEEENATVPNQQSAQLPDLKRPTFKRLYRSDLKREGFHAKFPKILTEYGFQDQNRTGSTTEYSEPYIRPFQLPSDDVTSRKKINNSGINSIEKLIERKRNQVEYDMDEQDYLYLKQRNENSKNIIKITPEVFEIIITALENEWDKLEHKMNSLSNSAGSGPLDHSNKLLTLDQATSNEKYGNDDGIVPGSFYDQKCAVCNDSDCDNSNAIVFCDGCDIAVHQECYGIAFIPEGQWLCRKCMINKNIETQCVFCPSKTGAFKQLDNSLWSHVICALWINELYFANPIYMEPIEGMDLIPKSRWKLSCYLCKQKMGACIQCSNRNCFQAYHVTCAKRAGLYMNFTSGVQGAISNKLTLKTFCEKHSPHDWDVSEVLRGIQRTKLFFRDTKILNDQNVKLSNNQKTANKLNIFKWKTENNTPIAPKLFGDVLFQLMLQLKVENQVTLPDQTNNQLRDLERLPNRSKESTWEEVRNIAYELCRYWCLKRGSKRGAPLIRKNNNLIATSSILYNTNSEGDLDSGHSAEFYAKELEDKVEAAGLLLEDLDKVIGMNSEWIQKQAILYEADETDFHLIDSVYFPIKMLIEYAVSLINDKVDPNHVIRNYKLREDASRVGSKEGTAPPNTENTTAHLDERSKELPERDPTTANQTVAKNRISMFQILEKNSGYGYKSVDDFRKDVERFFAIIVEENKPSHIIHRLMKKWMKEFYANLEELYDGEKKVFRDSNNRSKGEQAKLPNDEVSEDHEEKSNQVLPNFIEVPFVRVEGDQIRFKEYNPKRVLEENDLSEVEDTIEKAEEKKALFERFLSGNP